MKLKSRKPEKAYKNVEFLNGPDARILRILSEFLEPQQRFRRNDIRDTIVFFGSARIQDPEESTRRIRRLRGAMRRGGRGKHGLETELRSALAAAKLAKYYTDCVELSRLLTTWSKGLRPSNRFVVCSGGGPGIMEAANRGAALAGGKSIGLNISLPFEQFVNRYVSEELKFEFHYFFLRKFWFAYLAKALVAFPGGFGTMDELMEILTLLQTGKIKKKLTVIVYGSEYWKSIINFHRLVELGMISEEDLRLFRFLDTPEEAFEHLKASLQRDYSL
jgi:uncharacterized protein (TIGR00730 family)